MYLCTIMMNNYIDERQEAIQDVLAQMVGGERERDAMFADSTHLQEGCDALQRLVAEVPSSAINTQNFQSLFITTAGDMRVILYMIARCLVDMRMMKDEPERDEKLINEAEQLYAPLAHKLGLYQVKTELEDLSLKYSDHEAYYHIAHALKQKKRERDAYIEKFVRAIDERISQTGLHYHIKQRTKSIHSIWQKMKKQEVDVDGVFDLFALRIILESPVSGDPDSKAVVAKEHADCWQVFSIITDMYTSNPKRMRDWLSKPKQNGYESLHITVKGPDEHWVEVQIRTERMDDIAEHGLAAHWRYKGIKSTEGGIEAWLANIRTALETGEKDSQTGLVENEVFVFTPRGDLFRLPMGATVLDFAYTVHTQVGNHCTGARIGNKNVTLKHQLQTGDHIEIQTSNSQSPKQDWLSIATTSRAKAKIRQSLKEAEAGRTTLAKELLERKMKNRKVEYSEPTLMHTIKKLGFKVVTDFYRAIAEERLDVNQVLEAYQAQQRHERGEDEVVTRSASDFVMQDGKAKGASHANDDVLVIDQNLKGIEFQLAKCCSPIYGDEVFGFISATGGIKIHRTDCPNARQMRERAPYRFVRARWAQKQGSQYSITLRIVGQDDMGIVNNITSIITKEERMLMRSISIDSHDGLFSGHLTVVLEDTDRLAGLIKKLKTVRGVKNVTRM